MLTQKAMDKMVEFIEKKTHDFFDSTIPVLSEKAQRLQEAIPSFGCNAKAVANVLSILLDEQISDKECDKYDNQAFMLGVLLVPTGNDNDHNYQLNVPALVLVSGTDNKLLQFVKDKSDKYLKHIGNHVTNVKCYLRASTHDEIVKFVKDGADILQDYFIILE